MRSATKPDCRRLLAILASTAMLACMLPTGAAFAEEPAPAAMPSFEELEAAGAVIRDIQVDTEDIFDLDDPRENNALFRLANGLNVVTRPSVIARQLLFKVGEPVSARLIAETERLLRAKSYLQDVSIRPVAWGDGQVDIVVRTRDAWTLEPSFSFSREGGKNSSGLSFTESNLLGTGVSIGVESKSDVDRKGTLFDIAHPNAFGGRTEIGYQYADFEDGERHQASLIRPFYELDARWSAGASVGIDEGLESIYQGGVIDSQYRRVSRNAQLFGGWSPGLVDGWARRYTVGLRFNEDRYELEPGLTPPAVLPEDRTRTSPFLRFEAIEDDFRELRNRNKIERPEYFEFGVVSRVELARSMTALGSSQNIWQYSAGISNGFELGKSDVFASLSLSGEYGEGHGRNEQVGSNMQYYRPTSPRGLFYASLSAAKIVDPDSNRLLVLGGDNGLRGYPLRYQSGQQRVLLTVEQRVYSDWYPFRLFRVGGAVFYDLGRAWVGEPDSSATANRGWLSNIGIGARLLSTRSASGKVFHIDLAFPLHDDPNIDNVQFLFKNKVEF
jgi:outer membrane protein assembly factor BamA